MFATEVLLDFKPQTITRFKLFFNRNNLHEPFGFRVLEFLTNMSNVSLPIAKELINLSSNSLLTCFPNVTAKHTDFVFENLRRFSTPEITSNPQNYFSGTKFINKHSIFDNFESVKYKHFKFSQD